jgi:site-specific recombinase XerD
LCRDEEHNATLARILEASRADSTVAKYKRSFKLWKDWCRDNGLCPLPANHDVLARYFIHLYNTKVPYSSIESAFYAIKWHFDCSPDVVHNPCDMKFLKLLLGGLKRILAKPVVQKEPITADMLQKIVEKFGCCENLMHIRMCAMLLVSYAGFFRYDEISNLRLCDVQLFLSHVKFFVRKSKTDQYREGAWVVVAATGKLTCPVAMLRKYISLAALEV